eukprot:642765_1
MEVFKLAVLLSLISSRITTAIDACGTNDGMKYVVFNGASCGIAGYHGKACELYSKSGVLEVIRKSTGVYMVYFEQPYTTNNYGVVTSSNLQATGGAYSSIAGNDDSLDSYYGVSKYFIRIETRKLGPTLAVQADSDYISVVTKPSFGDTMHSVVFDGDDCPQGVCNLMSQDLVTKVTTAETGLYKVTFSEQRGATHYLVLASSNVWGTGGVIASIGGNTIHDDSNEGIERQYFQVDTRTMHDNDRVASDYVSVIAGTPAGKKFVVFNGQNCIANPTYGKICQIYQQRGVAAVEREDTGQYKIWWALDMSNANYVVLCDSNVLGTYGTVCGLGGNNQGAAHHGISSRFAEVQTRKMADNSYGNSDYISVLAFETPAPAEC